MQGLEFDALEAAFRSRQDPATRGHSLTGPWTGFHRYRLGQICIIVSIERAEVTVSVIKINRRDSVY